MSAHPISTDDSPPLSLFLSREIAKKNLHSSKWGSIPRYPSHNAIKGHDVLDPIGIQMLQLNLVVVQQSPEESVGRNCKFALVKGCEGHDVAIGQR
jgi:hypothetical protein